jgi:hypothetical protein
MAAFNLVRLSPRIDRDRREVDVNGHFIDDIPNENIINQQREYFADVMTIVMVAMRFSRS